MTFRMWALAAIAAFTALVTVPARVHGLQGAAPADQHADHHPGQADAPDKAAVATPQANMMDMMARMKAMDTKLDDLVKKMNAAKGLAKTDAMAELLTALVEDRRSMHEAMMSNMMSMTDNMNMIGGRGGHTETAPRPQKK